MAHGSDRELASRGMAHDVTWFSYDRAGCLAIFQSNKAGCVPRAAFEGASSSVRAAIHRAWIETAALPSAGAHDHLWALVDHDADDPERLAGARAGGPHAIAFRDRACAEALLAKGTFRWVDAASGARNVLVVDALPKDLAHRIVVDGGYEGSVALDDWAFGDDLANCMFAYDHPDGGSARSLYCRHRTPAVTMTVGDLPPEVVSRILGLDSSFRESTSIDLAKLVASDTLM